MDRETPEQWIDACCAMKFFLNILLDVASSKEQYIPLTSWTNYYPCDCLDFFSTIVALIKQIIQLLSPEALLHCLGVPPPDAKPHGQLKHCGYYSNEPRTDYYLAFYDAPGSLMSSLPEQPCASWITGWGTPIEPSNWASGRWKKVVLCCRWGTRS